MDRWNLKEIAFVENKKIDFFLKEISEVCKRHNMSISHEDGHGSFEIETEYNVRRINEVYERAKNNFC